MTTQFFSPAKGMIKRSQTLRNYNKNRIELREERCKGGKTKCEKQKMGKWLICFVYQRVMG